MQPINRHTASKFGFKNNSGRLLKAINDNFDEELFCSKKTIIVWVGIGDLMQIRTFKKRSIFEALIKYLTTI